MMEPRLRPRSKTAGAVRGQIRRFPIPLPFKTKRCNGELSSKLFTGTYVEVSGIENALFYRAFRTLCSNVVAWKGKGRSMRCIFSLELRFVSSRVIARGSADNCNFSAPLESRLL
jgi:hypothetical protein